MSREEFIGKLEMVYVGDRNAFNDIVCAYDSVLSANEKAIEYITSYEAISTIQGLDKIEQNKTLDERTMNVMVERYLQVHYNLLNILQNGSDNDEQRRYL